MAFKPTDSQIAAINTEGNILVSAAAGSGKTAVLVERVIHKLTRINNPLRADELLIVTFTNAAAAEMRSRIEKRINEECANNPNQAGLLLQKHLFNNAKICTIDSFCIDFVRENFDKLDISPDFKIAEEHELKTINEDVLYSIINRYFESGNNDFLDLLNLLGSEFDESNFAKFLFSVYEHSRNLPFPEIWYDKIINNYNNGEFSNNNIYYDYSFEKARFIIDNAIKMLTDLKNVVFDTEALREAYMPVFMLAEQILLSLRQKAATNEWDVFYDALYNYSLPELPSVKGITKIENAKLIKDNYKFLNGKVFDSLFEIFYEKQQFINKQFNKLFPLIKLFVNILKEYDQKIFEAYKENNLFTFHNTEHLALKLLCEYKDGEIIASQSGMEIIEQYKEVMVDEYQDVNDLQNILFYVLSGFNKKLFAVGDVKQSIYGFRGANPDNFLNKKNNSDIENKDNINCKKIVLGNNFRSKNNICNFINTFFKIFMNENTGKLIYNDDEKLIPSAVFPVTDKAAVSFDFIDLTNTKENSLILEARRIAAYIKETIDGEPCIKQDEKTLRKAKYGDFTILLRNFSTKGPKFVTELEKQGIPVNINLNKFNQSIEVLTFLSLLKVIDNPKNDIALASVLLSPIFGFTPEELANIRSLNKNTDLYTAIIIAADNLNIHAKDFLSKIEEFRLKAVTLPLGKLVSALLSETEYLNIVSSMNGGTQRRKNLLYLNELASQFVSQKMNSISSFCDYILKMSTKSSVTNKGDSVNIMTMHSSKGLQFPICIIADISSSLGGNDSRNSSVYSTKYGLGFKYYDEDIKDKLSTVPYKIILDEINSIMPEEELRLLYVAMTRAEDKLHFVGSYSDFTKTVTNIKNLYLNNDNKVDYGVISRTNSYSDWLIYCLLSKTEYQNVLLNYTANDKYENGEIIINLIDGNSLNSTEKIINNTEVKVNEEFVNSIKENLSYVYPYEELNKIESKISVSQLVNKSENDKYAFSSKPSFMNYNGITPTGRGSAMHKVIEFFDFSNSDNIEQEIDRLYEWQYITEEEKNSLSIKDLKDFFESDIFRRIKNSERVEREMRFISEINACDIDSSLNEKLANEKVIIQGAVDICFIENGELVILDFKTDRVEDITELRQAYAVQLNSYAKACEKIFNLKVKQKVIYSFSKSATIDIL